MIIFRKIKKEETMRFIRDLSWETKKRLERIYQYSEHHQTRQRAKCLLLSFQGTPIKELMKIFEVARKTIYNWFSEWEENKLVGLYNRAGQGRKPKLTIITRKRSNKVGKRRT